MFRTLRLWIVAVLWVAVASSTGRAVEVQNFLAVLEVEQGAGSVSDDEADLLGAALRGAAAASSPGVGVPVMTREVMTEMLSPDQLKCGLYSCMANVGKQLQTRFVTGGKVVRVDGNLALTVEMYESVSGRMLGSKLIQESGVRQLVAAAERQLPEEYRTWLVQALGADSVVTSTTTQTRVTFLSDPPGAVVMADTGLVCNATPCEEDLPVGSREITFTTKGYDTLKRSVRVAPGMAPISVNLVPSFTALTIVTQPPGLAVKIDKKDVGATPIVDMKLLPGPHEVLVDDPCFGLVGETVQLKKGSRRELSYAPPPRLAAVDASVEDEAGNSLDATFTVDGVTMPGARFKAPLCSREVTATTRDGRSVSQDLRLQEKMLTAIHMRVSGGVAQGSREGVGSSGTAADTFALRPQWLSAREMPLSGVNGFDVPWPRLSWITGTLALVAGAALTASQWQAPPNDIATYDTRAMAVGSLLAGSVLAGWGISADIAQSSAIEADRAQRSERPPVRLSTPEGYAGRSLPSAASGIAAAGGYAVNPASSAAGASVWTASLDTYGLALLVLTDGRNVLHLFLDNKGWFTWRSGTDTPRDIFPNGRSAPCTSMCNAGDIVPDARESVDPLRETARIGRIAKTYRVSLNGTHLVLENQPSRVVIDVDLTVRGPQAIRVRTDSGEWRALQ